MTVPEPVLHTTAEKLAELRERLELAKEPGGEKAAARRELGISQGALYEILQRILARFEKAGLRDYLGKLEKTKKFTRLTEARGKWPEYGMVLMDLRKNILTGLV